MRLYELLNGPTGPTPPSSAATAPMVNPAAAAPAPTAAVQQPQPGMGQQANMLTDFFSTPHPIGQPAAPAKTPDFVDKAVGGQAPNFLGQINRGLTGGSVAPVPPTKPAGS